MIGDRHEIDGVWYEAVQEEESLTCRGCDFAIRYSEHCSGYNGLKPYEIFECGMKGTILKKVKEDVMQDYKIFVGNSEEIKKMVCKKARILGYDAKVIDCNFWYLYSYENSYANFGYDNSIKYFKQHKNKEISFHEFLELPEPKQEKTIDINGKPFTMDELNKIINQNK